MGVKQVYPGRYDPAGLLRPDPEGEGHRSPTAWRPSCTCCSGSPADRAHRPLRLEGDHRRRAAAQGAVQGGARQGHRHLRRLRPVSETCPFIMSAQLLARPGRPGRGARGGDPLPGRPAEPAGRPAHRGRRRCATCRTTARPPARSSCAPPGSPWATSRTSGTPRPSGPGGYLHTGDIGSIDELGYLQVSDRIKDVIKTGGEWISSLDLENIIGQHPAVSEVAVIGVPDDKWGERPLALVVLRDGAPGRRRRHPAPSPWTTPRRASSRSTRVPDRIVFVRRDRQDQRRQDSTRRPLREEVPRVDHASSRLSRRMFFWATRDRLSRYLSTGYSAGATESDSGNVSRYGPHSS